MKKNDYLKLLIALAIPQIAGLIGSLFTMSAIPTWYSTLVKSALNPPAWVFAPVWTILFLLMGIASFLIWQKDHQSKIAKIALSIFGGQLVLNTLWSILFFGWHNPEAAFVEIIVLWLAIIATIFYFAKISKLAAWLLVPYILWVSFASFLNYSLWQLNIAVNLTACTAEAKICPDGSAVGRQGPLCEFTSCPEVTSVNNNSVGLANPASVNCQKVGGKLIIQKRGDGGEYGLCYFEDNRACEEWSLLRGDCAIGGIKTTGYDTEEQKYCAWLGGHTTTNLAAVCTFSDGSICNLTKLFSGECQKGQSLAEQYQVEKILTEVCIKDADCQTPAEYQIQSRCPFTAKCLEKKCAVVCPKF